MKNFSNPVAVCIAAREHTCSPQGQYEAKAFSKSASPVAKSANSISVIEQLFPLSGMATKSTCMQFSAADCKPTDLKV